VDEVSNHASRIWTSIHFGHLASRSVTNSSYFLLLTSRFFPFLAVLALNLLPSSSMQGLTQANYGVAVCVAGIGVTTVEDELCATGGVPGGRGETCPGIEPVVACAG
jgi:hypothetical protein